MNNVEKEIQQFENSEQIYRISSVWKMKPLKIIQKIAIFITKMKHFSPIYRFKILNKNIFYLIRDRTSSFQYYLYSRLLENQPTRFGEIKYEAKLMNAIWWRLWSFLKSNQTVLLPADKFLFVWDVILMFVTIVNILYVPFQLSFDLGKEEIGNAYLLFSTLPSCIFLIELILNFFKGYYVRGILHTSKHDIFWHYVKGEFILDLTVVLPFIISWFGYSFANYLMLIRMTKVRRTMVVIEEISNFKEKTAVIYSLFCLIYSLLLISHFCACLFHYFAILEIDNGYSHTWLHQQGIYESDAFVKYFTSLYWVTITSMTVGYGDIVPVTTPEKILVTFMTFLVVGTFGYALGMIQSIFYKLAEQQNLNNAKLRLVSNHIKQRGLNTQLQFRVRKYIEYYLQFKQEEELDLDELMGQLNPKLKQEVQIAMYFSYFKKSKLLGSNLSDEILKKLCYCVHERTYAPEEFIIKKDDHPEKLYIVLSGKIKSVLLDRTIKRYVSGKLVCEREFFFQDQMQFDMVAQTFVQVAYINQNDFLNILQKDTRQYEKYRLILDGTQFGDNNNQIICEACSSHHQFKHCPLVFFRKNKNKVISIYNSSVDHERQMYMRQRKKRRFNSQLVKERAFEQFLEQNKTLAVVDNKLLIRLGLQRNDEDEASYPDQTSVHAPQLTPQNQLEQKFVFKNRITRQVSHRCLFAATSSGNNAQENQEDIQTQIFNSETNIDKVEEYDYYYPHYNITKVIKLINNQNIYSKVLDKIRGHKNRFAQYIARQIMYKIL
ncbi:unnamed protein product (macronuclear) [Paramecium tetraurelia]|uniref:Cyclic nucleotide-binding domain-containing protein n=1 Tax=Paramecium tetraurelia TaxID=5888 RepID=A0BZ01_PARTE|nr:uncharacterized protein GSPATT00033621001 [Paramecium tetraurelia]CAK63768.1 unnamed protein product [Paramecium tetraurelia]|eukprot:XP_001431166.1 hypothetical protein (macronuclear) [Paramecium tetraurelia strain d4-2]